MSTLALHPPLGRHVVTRPLPADVLSRTWVVSLALALVTLVGAALRFVGAGTSSLRLDEAQSIAFASYPLHPVTGSVVPSLLDATAADVQPPGYLLMLHVWMHMAGTGVGTLRLPSELAATLCIPALFLLASLMYGRRIGLIAALLGAISPFWIWHAQEVRMYSFLLLFTIVASYGLLLAMERRRRAGWLALGVASALGIYTHYFFFLVMLVHGIYVVSRFRHFGWGRILRYAITMAAVLASYIPWIMVLRHSYKGAGDPSLSAPTLYTPLVYLAEFAFGYLSTPITSMVVAGWPMLVLLALMMSPFVRPSRQGRLPWMLLVVPLLLTLVISYAVRPVVAERYLIIATPGLLILVAVAIGRMTHRRSRYALTALLVGSLVLCSSVQRTEAANPAQEDYQSVVNYLEAHAGPNDAVGLDAEFNQFPYLYYANDNIPVYELPFPPSGGGHMAPPLTPASVATELAGIEAGRTYLWVIYYLDTSPGTNAEEVRRYLDYHTSDHEVVIGSDAQRGTSEASDINVQLVKYRLIPTPAAQMQLRPPSLADVRLITGIAPNLRRPFAPAGGPPGKRATTFGDYLAPVEPHETWRAPPLGSRASGVRLQIFNPNGRRMTALISDRNSGSVSPAAVTVPAFSVEDVSLGEVGNGGDGAIDVVGSAPFVLTRTFFVGGMQITENGTPGSPAARRSL